MAYYPIKMAPRRAIPILYACAAVAFVCGVVMTVGYAVNVGYDRIAGTVIDNQSQAMVTRRGGEVTGRKQVVCPRVRFRPKPNASFEFIGTSACAVSPRYKAGDTVTVYYRPEDPGDANLNAPDRPFKLMLAGYGVAAGILLVAFIMRRIARRREGENGS